MGTVSLVASHNVILCPVFWIFFYHKNATLAFKVCCNWVSWSDFTVNWCDILSVGQKKATRWGKMTKQCVHVFTCRYIWLFFAPRVVCFCPTYHFWKHFLIGSFRSIIINITYKFFMILKENIMNFHLIPPWWLFDFWKNIYKPKSSWLFFAPLSSNSCSYFC